MVKACSRGGCRNCGTSDEVVSEVVLGAVARVVVELVV
jgi:hypothetical protein